MSDTSSVVKRRGRRPGTMVRAKCCVCGAIEIQSGAGNYSRCQSCKDAGLRAPSRRTQYDCTGKEDAICQVSAGVRDGILKHPKNFVCTDCDAAAVEYEHRDYNKPLDVEPICRSCNLRRGPAIPRQGWLEHAAAHQMIPYTLRSNALRVFRLLGWTTTLLEAMPTKLTYEHWSQLVASRRTS